VLYNCGNSTSGPNNTTQFGDVNQCMTVAASYPNSAANDASSSNVNHSLGCRQYHSQAAQGMGASTHCSHAGPTGGGICGNARDAWGTMINSAPCNDSTVNSFLSMAGNTQADALVPPGFSTPYFMGLDTSGDTQACRFYHLTVASTTPNPHCAHGTVSGGNYCGFYTPNLCAFIGSACGFGATSYQFASNAACISGLTSSNSNNISVGTTVPQDTSANSFECRFYHATVAASYSAGGSNANAINATGLHQFHCGHVLQVSTPGGCGTAATTPTPAKTPTPSTTTNAASATSVLVSAVTLAGCVFLL